MSYASMLQLVWCNFKDQQQSCFSLSNLLKQIDKHCQRYILVMTLFCPKGTEMAKHTTNTTEVIPQVKAVESGSIHSLLMTWSRC